ncbi:FAD dependent oxidoreductase [Xylariaceae sp. FL0255]|nr:FAD dependent oxidoreductase [Xylariaceae sp. FL0255]
MEARTAIPVTLPRPNPTQSYWQQDADPIIAEHRTTSTLPSKADTLIIGSGITGTAIAYNLLSTQSTTTINNSERGNDPPRRPPSVVMLEARTACSGATGRNGGHTKAASYRTFAHHASHQGMAEAAKIARLELANIRAVHTFAAKHGIDCDSHPCTTVDAVYDREQFARDVRAVRDLQDALGQEDDAAVYEIQDAEEMASRFFCPGVAGGISYEAGNINAYKFTIGVLRLCLSLGLNLQTQTPATAIERRDDGSWTVETPRGTIIARRLVLATNGYTAHLVPRFHRIIVPLRGHVTAQRGGTGLPRDGLPYTYSYIYNGGYDYMVPRPKGAKLEGDIAIGGQLASAKNDGLGEYGTTDDTTCDPDIVRALGETLPRYFGEYWGADHEDGRVRAVWSGIMGYGPDGLPFVGKMPGEEATNLWVCASFQGHGMVLCWMCAKGLVEMMNGRDNEELRGWFPDAFRVAEDRFDVSFRGRVHDLKD